MNQELENKLINNHYILNGSLKNGDSRLPFPMFGIECDDGWYNLLDILCSQIEYLLDNNYPEYKDDFLVDQIKEKYGTLRFYVSGGNDQILDVIDFFEVLSGRICENCGRTGRTVEHHSWLKTVCKECEEKWIMRK